MAGRGARPLISAIGASFAYRRSGLVTSALEGLDWNAEAVRIIGRVGPSGCGNSTLLRGDCMAPFGGSLAVDLPHSFTVRDLSVPLQSPALLPYGRGECVAARPTDGPVAAYRSEVREHSGGGR